MRLLERLAIRAPVPVYAALGEGGAALVEPLALSPEIALTASVRHASVLLVAGRLRREDHEALARLHDQLPHPRATVWWGAEPVERQQTLEQLEPGETPVQRLRTLYRQLLDGTRDTESSWRPDEPPHPWRGLNENGQGGKGMMGGTPYGRPMAMTMDDLRDGLALDAFVLTIGPFLPLLPPGLALQLTLQGDVIQSAQVTAAPYTDAVREGADLRRAARLLDLLQLAALADRCRRAALRGLEDGTVAGAAARAGAFLAIPPGLGRWGGQDVRDRLRRALGVPGSAAAAGDQRQLTELLPGLEWNEAMLVVNSFDPTTLASIAPVTPKDEGGTGKSHAQHASHDGAGRARGTRG